jgi:hypothetical protein
VPVDLGKIGFVDQFNDEHNVRSRLRRRSAQ